jgi:hypothetical protein
MLLLLSDVDVCAGRHSVTLPPMRSSWRDDEGSAGAMAAVAAISKSRHQRTSEQGADADRVDFIAFDLWGIYASCVWDCESSPSCAMQKASQLSCNITAFLFESPTTEL